MKKLKHLGMCVLNYPIVPGEQQACKGPMLFAACLLESHFSFYNKIYVHNAMQNAQYLIKISGKAHFSCKLIGSFEYHFTLVKCRLLF